ncbi:MAG TPA: ATP-binding protein [Acidimicrobiales bacterium]|nr:ATP-binding protein [Acidimicrobiales bacterium]
MEERAHVPDTAETTITLPAEPASAARAREFVRSLLRRSRHKALEDAALLCVSELVANVSVHTRSKQCVITLVDEPDDVIIEVADEANEPPVLQKDGQQSDHGRGLHIIEALAGEWGVRQRPDDGKSVWLRIFETGQGRGA